MAAQRRDSAVCSTRILTDVLCGIDGTRSAYEAVRQAAWLAGADGHLTLLAAAVKGSGQWRMAAFAPARAERALDYVRRIAKEAGVSSDREVRGARRGGGGAARARAPMPEESTTADLVELWRQLVCALNRDVGVAMGF